jgi:hypothetical protein
VWPWVLLGIVILFLGGCFAFVALIGSSIDSSRTSSPSTSRTALPPTPPSDLQGLTPTSHYTPAPTWNPGEADFLIVIHSALSDWQFTNDPGNDAALVDLGHKTCNTLQAGASERQAIDWLAHHSPTSTMPYSDVRLFVHQAEGHICPDVYVAP